MAPARLRQDEGRSSNALGRDDSADGNDGTHACDQKLAVLLRAFNLSHLAPAFAAEELYQA